MKAMVVAWFACVLVPVVALAQEGQAQGQASLNTITSVNVRGGTVEIVGTKKPNFTTFTMTDPPRLVIDISEAVFSGVKEEISVGNGTITGIRTASYGSDDSSIARVLVGYEREVETDIQTTGNSLVVSVAGSGGAAVAARPSTPAGESSAQAQERVVADASKATQPDAKQQERAAAEAAAATQAQRQQQERAAAEAAKAAQAEAEAQRQAQARAEAERKAQEEASRVAAQQAEQQRQQQEREAKAAAAAEEKKRREDEARAAAEEKKRQQEEARTAAEEKKRQQDEARAAAASAAEEKKRAAAEERARKEAEAQAAAEEKKRQQDEARAAAASAAEEKKRAAAEERQRQREEAQAAAEEKKRQRQEASQPRVAQAETPHRAPEQGGGSVAVSSRRKTMTLVGFKQESSASRVFVHTNEPVRYTLSGGDRMVVIELENTHISESNNSRALDTSFFDTAVASVNADPGPSHSVRVAIRLKERVAYEAHQEGNVLSIEFQRPAHR